MELIKLSLIIRPANYHSQYKIVFHRKTKWKCYQEFSFTVWRTFSKFRTYFRRHFFASNFSSDFWAFRSCSTGRRRGVEPGSSASRCFRAGLLAASVMSRSSSVEWSTSRQLVVERVSSWPKVFPSRRWFRATERPDAPMRPKPEPRWRSTKRECWAFCCYKRKCTS